MSLIVNGLFPPTDGLVHHVQVNYCKSKFKVLFCVLFAPSPSLRTQRKSSKMSGSSRPQKRALASPLSSSTRSFASSGRSSVALGRFCLRELALAELLWSSFSSDLSNRDLPKMLVVLRNADFDCPVQNPTNFTGFAPFYSKDHQKLFHTTPSLTSSRVGVNTTSTSVAFVPLEL